MTTQQIASRLVELCQHGEFEKAQLELYSDDVKSIEPYDTPEYPKLTEGKDKVFAKTKQFDESVKETHAISVSDPIVATHSFAVKLTMDLTMKKNNERMNMSELCLYKVKDGKVVSEEFFM